MKKIATFFALLFFHFVNAQPSCTSNRYLNEVFSGYNLTNAIYFGSSDPYGLGSSQDLYLDVYEPAGDTLSNRPVIIHKFGGAYLIGWRSLPNVPDFAEMYTKRGFVFISIDYRLGFNPLDGESAERAVYRGIQDQRTALRFIVDNAASYGIDTSNIFLTGTSAGCVSSLGQTFMDESDRPLSTYGTLLEPADLGCLDCSGNSNFNNNEVAIHGIINNWGALLDTALIDLQDDPTDNVPVISFHGTDDNAVFYVEGPPFSASVFPNLQGSFLIHQRLENQGIKNRLYPLVGEGHEPQLLNPDIADTIAANASQFLYEIMQGNIDSILGDTLVCVNDVQSYSVQYKIGSSYCWTVSGGTIISQNANTVNIQWNTAGTHSLTLQEQNYLQVNKARTLNIEVQAPFGANINYTSTDGLFTFNGNAQANASYHWSFGDGYTGNGITTNHQYQDTGVYEVILAINNNYCTVNDTLSIISDICPNAGFSYTLSDSGILLNNTAQFYDHLSWNFGDGNTSNTAVSAHNYSTEGNYDVQMIASNQFCSDTITQSVSINFCSRADFTFTSNGLLLSFINNSYNNYSNFWNFGDGTTNGTANPNHLFTSAGSYQVQLIVFDNNLCSDTIIKTITVTQKEDTVSNITNLNTAAKFKIYPNPTSGIINIISFENESILNFELYHLIGEKLSLETIQSKNKLDVSSLQKGIYILKINWNKETYYHKIIKQ